jgi:large subunit ribosomal protein L21
MYAVIASGGKQYRVEEGGTVRVERLAADPGTSVTLDGVLMMVDGSTITAGTPTVKGATVTATVLGHGRGKKVTVFKYRSKAHYRRKQGHRQGFTTLKIEKIGR